MDWRLDKWLVTSVVVIVALLVLSAVLTYWNTRRLDENAGWIAHTHEVLDQTAGVLVALLDAETGERGFLLTGKDDFLEPYDAALTRLKERLATLTDLTSDNARQQERIQQLEQSIATQVTLLKEAIELRRKGQREVQAFLAADQSKARMDRIRLLITQMESDERALLEDRERQSRDAYQVAVTTGFVTAALGLVFIGGFVWLLDRNVAVQRKAAAVVHEQREWLWTTLTSIGDAVIATDTEARVTLLNAVAQTLTGWREKEAKGQPLETVFRIRNEETRRQVDNPALRALREGAIVGLANHTILIARDGTERCIDDSAAPIRHESGKVAGVVLVFRDVTARRQADRTARFLASIVESADDAIIGKDVNGIITSWNRAAERIFGYSAAEAVGQPIAMLAPPDRVAEMPAILARIRRGEKVDHFDTVRRAKDGRLVPVSLTVSPIRDENGKIVGASKISRDITERKRAEEALREEKARLHATLTGIGDAVIVTDAEGHITLLNPVAESLTGWKDEAMGRPVEEVFRILNEQTHRPVESPVRRVMREGTVVGLANHTILITKSGREIPIDDSGAPVQSSDGKIIAVVLVFRDITARRRAEERLRLLWEAASVLLTTNEPDAMLRELFARIGPDFGLDAYFSYAVDETGKALRLISSMGVPAEAASTISRLEFGQAICGTVAQQRRPLVATHIQQSDDPKAERVRSLGFRAYTCNPLQIDDNLLGTLSFASRSREQFDEEELEFLGTICRYVAVAHERLRLVGRLREADRRKDDFLATLAHELRNPLAPILNALELMRRAAGNTALLEQARGVMDRQLQRMVRLIDDLLDVSRITRGKVQLRKQRVELEEIVHSAVEAARPFLDAQGHELTITLPPGPVYLDGDPTRLAQVFANLLDNAAKYTDRGGHVWLSAERQEKEVIVSVRDTGIGIAAEHLPKLFEMFSQVLPALERSQGGLGIGLSLVRGLVELHGGRVEARSGGIGLGSEFLVHLPLADGPMQPQPKETAPDETAANARNYRILIVDDNRDAADSLALMLSMIGHETRTAYDGREAVELAAEYRPDVVLLDIGLPKMNGYEAARSIREQPWGKKMVLLALTGWGQEEDKRQALEAGFDRHLTKPVDPKVLEKLLASIRP